MLGDAWPSRSEVKTAVSFGRFRVSETHELRPPAARLEGRRRRGQAAGHRGAGATLACAHARWGDRIAIGTYLGKGDTFERALADYAATYADQNERDYESFVSAVTSGRLTPQAGL